MRFPEVKQQNRKMLILFLAGLILTLILMSLPLYSFDIGIYTKKSANTFVGDEKYQTVRAEVEEVAEDYRAQGFDVEIQESVLERVNSKGKTTSLVTFTVAQRYSRNLFSFLGKSFPSSTVLAAMLVLMLLALILELTGLKGTDDLLPRYLDKRTARLRSGAIAVLVLALLLVPVFILMNNVIFFRRLSLYSAGLITEGKDIFFARLDRFFFDGQMGENAEEALAGLKINNSPMLWLMMLTLFVSFTAAISLRHGEIKNGLLRGAARLPRVLLAQDPPVHGSDDRAGGRLPRRPRHRRVEGRDAGYVFPAYDPDEMAVEQPDGHCAARRAAVSAEFAVCGRRGDGAGHALRNPGGLCHGADELRGKESLSGLCHHEPDVLAGGPADRYFDLKYIFFLFCNYLRTYRHRRHSIISHKSCYAYCIFVYFVYPCYLPVVFYAQI